MMVTSNGVDQRRAGDLPASAPRSRLEIISASRSSTSGQPARLCRRTPTRPLQRSLNRPWPPSECAGERFTRGHFRALMPRTAGPSRLRRRPARRPRSSAWSSGMSERASVAIGRVAERDLRGERTGELVAHVVVRGRRPRGGIDRGLGNSSFARATGRGPGRGTFPCPPAGRDACSPLLSSSAFYMISVTRWHSVFRG